MALIKCGTCTNQISSRAKCCPKCGGASQTASEPVPAPSPPAKSPSAPSATTPLNVALGTVSDNAPGLAVEPEQPAESPQDWYYVSRTGRCGPVSWEALGRMQADGVIEETTQIWKTGMPDWVPYHRHVDSAREQAPAEEPSVPASAASIYVWPMAFAPLWGAAVQILATEVLIAVTRKPLPYYTQLCQLWWLLVASVMLTSYLDYRHLAKSCSPAMRGCCNRLLWLLVPVYLYRREKRLAAKSIKLYVWLGCCLSSVVLFVFLNHMYAQLPSK